MKRLLTYDTHTWEIARKRLYWKYRKLGSFSKLAKDLQVNVYHVYSYIAHGIVPKNKAIQRSLGIHLRKPVTINQLLQLPIQEMPPEILKLALYYRE